VEIQQELTLAVAVEVVMTMAQELHLLHQVPQVVVEQAEVVLAVLLAEMVQPTLAVVEEDLQQMVVQELVLEEVELLL
tara:strand:+ start:541 stop:774 length:234 start_codon:yes stop_codon:yes gene_type:complete